MGEKPCNIVAYIAEKRCPTLRKSGYFWRTDMMLKLNSSRNGTSRNSGLKTLIPDIVVSTTYSVTILSALQIVGYFVS